MSKLKTSILHNMVTIISIGQQWSAGGLMAGKKADLNDVQLPRPRHDPTRAVDGPRSALTSDHKSPASLFPRLHHLSVVLGSSVTAGTPHCTGDPSVCTSGRHTTTLGLLSCRHVVRWSHSSPADTRPRPGMTPGPVFDSSQLSALLTLEIILRPQLTPCLLSHDPKHSFKVAFFFLHSKMDGTTQKKCFQKRCSSV